MTGSCPNCGYCPHCGRGGYRTMPLYPPAYPSPAYPWYPGPIWISSITSGASLDYTPATVGSNITWTS